MTFLTRQCVVANVDADAAPNRPLGEKYGVQGFPTIKFFPKGTKGGNPLYCMLNVFIYSSSTEPVLYDGERSEAAFVSFLNEKCGTQRAIGGGLNEEAGRLPEFDSLASKFFEATASARQTIFKDASALAQNVGPAAKHYLRVMEKVVNGSEEYLAKESKR